MANVHTPVGVLSFPALFTPRARSPGNTPDFHCNVLFDKIAQSTPQFAALKRAVAECINEKWGPGKAADRDFVKKLRLPFRPCAEKSYQGYDIEGGIYISPWSTKRPDIVDARLQDITVPTDVWAGQMVRVSVNPFAYSNTGNMGVSFGLNNVQVCRTDGVRLDGRRAGKDDFSTYDDGLGLQEDADATF
jgi:hypothetical protein